MKLDDSNKRYSHFIAGILIISLASIFLACALGVWDHKVISNNNPLPNGVVTSWSNGNKITENNDFVIPPGVASLPTHEKVCRKLDTVEGWIFFDQVPVEDLPLTITQAVVDDWGYAHAYSYGGYSFVEGGADLYQKDDGWIGSITYSIEGTPVETTEIAVGIDLDGDTIMEDDYTVMDYTIKLTLDQAVINIDSNHLPQLYDSGWMWAYDCPPVEDLDKEVVFKEKMKWEGCHQNDQQFRVMLAYIRMLRSPELPIKNFIASFEQ
ncbi:MAG: hypothetical protein ACFFA4_15615 [Promethearchaeota archaeon]